MRGWRSQNPDYICDKHFSHSRGIVYDEVVEKEMSCLFEKQELMTF